MPKKKRLTNEVIERMEQEAKAETKKEKKKTSKKKKVEEPVEEVKEEVVVEEKILEEEIEETALVEQEETSIDLKRENLAEIALERKKQREIPKHRKLKINRKIWENMIYAIVAVIILMGLQFVYLYTDIEVFRRVLKVTSIVSMFITIIIFEIAYKKDNTTVAGHGIEMMLISIYVLILLSFYEKSEENFVPINVVVLCVFLVYFVIKSIIVDIKIRKTTRHHTSDIHKILKGM